MRLDSFRVPNTPRIWAVFSGSDQTLGADIVING